MLDQFPWYLARAGGMVAWWLFGLSIVCGILLSTRTLGRRPTGPWLLDLHRFVGGLALIFSGVHLLGLWADDYVEFGLAELLVPMASTWRPGAVAWGVVAFWLLVAIEVTSLVKDHIPDGLWRWIHTASAPGFVFGTVHGLQAGTDVGNPLLWWSGASIVTAFVGLLAFRLATMGVDVRPGAGRRGERIRADLAPPVVEDDKLPV